MKRVLLFLLVGIVFVPQSASANCVSQLYSNNSGSSIGIQVGSGWGTEPPPIGSAINIWTNSCSGMGTNSPTLLDGGNGTINVTVDRMSGANPQPGGGCGRFNHQLSGNSVVGGSIEIYQSTNAGADCAWVMAHANLDNLIAHEIGHVLGLDNSSCANYLMGPDWVNSNPQSDECAQVDQAWQTPTEEQPPEPVDPICCLGEPHPRYEPLILDLNGDGIHTTAIEEWPVEFDLTGDGVDDVTAWTSPFTEEGILYYDHNHNGVIDGGAELFGDATIKPDGVRARHGFEALAAYDQPENGGNGDGVISPGDTVWGKLRLWVDRNHDGAVSPDENDSLGARHVIELALEYVTMTSAENYGQDAAGNWHLMKGTFVQRIGGKSLVRRSMHDVFFKVRVGTAESVIIPADDR